MDSLMITIVESLTSAKIRRKPKHFTLKKLIFLTLLAIDFIMTLYMIFSGESLQLMLDFADALPLELAKQFKESVRSTIYFNYSFSIFLHLLFIYGVVSHNFCISLFYMVVVIFGTISSLFLTSLSLMFWSSFFFGTLGSIFSVLFIRDLRYIAREANSQII